MSGTGSRLKTYAETGITQARTEIHIFKPNWPETLIEATGFLPRCARKHHEGTCGLFDEFT
jgi:hypothetical protein